MPRAKPERGHEPVTLSFSVPAPMAKRVWSEFEPGYGAQARWFRHVVQAYWDTRSVREENARLRARNLALESAFRKVQTAVTDVAA